MKIAIIGAGNMGGSIAIGLAKGTLVNEADITVSNRTEGKVKAIQASFPKIKGTTNNSTAVIGADIVVLAVKPWLVDTVMNEILPNLNLSKQILITVVAGVPFEHYNELIGDKCQSPIIFRVIPNTAIAIGESMTMIAYENASDAQIATVKALFDELGATKVIEERLMTAGIALCSCGTAYALRYLRAATEGGVELGLYANDAKEIVAQTMIGAAKLILANGTNPEVEIDKVTTPGGITIKGLNAMERAGFSNAVIEGLKASK